MSVAAAALQPILQPARRRDRPNRRAPESAAAAFGLTVPPGRLRQERFGSVRPVEEPAGQRRLYRLRVGGREVEAASDRTLLESASDGKIALDFSCTMGGCGACKARLVEGEVVLDEPSCLSDEERAAGLVLTCAARPRSDVVIERMQ